MWLLCAGSRCVVGDDEHLRRQCGRPNRWRGEGLIRSEKIADEFLGLEATFDRIAGLG